MADKSHLVDASNQGAYNTFYTPSPHDGSVGQGSPPSYNPGYPTQGQGVFSNYPEPIQSTGVDVNISVQPNSMNREGVVPPNYILQNVMLLFFCPLIFGIIGLVKGSSVRTVNGAGSSDWSEPINAKTIHSGGLSSASIGPIVGGSMTALIVIILFIVLAFVIFRRMKQRRSKADPAASLPNNAHDNSSKHENPAFDDPNQDPNTYQDLNADTPNYQNVTDPHAYQGLKKPTINVPYPDSTKSDLEDTYEEI